MTRILSIGAELDIATNNAWWTDEYNVKDYEIVFIHTQGLDEHIGGSRIHNLDDLEGLRLPSFDDVRTLIKTGGTVVATLPHRKQVPRKKLATGLKKQNILNWIPAQISMSTEEGESFDSNSVEKGWSWYFDQPFNWTRYINGGEAHGSLYSCSTQSLVKNRYGESLAVRFHFGKKMGEASPDWWQGQIYLIPLLEDWSYEDFCRNILNRVLRDEEVHSEESRPEWITEYSIPGEDKHQANIHEKQKRILELEEELQTEEKRLDSLLRFKSLLYGTGHNLEDIVHRSFEEVGLEVEGEQSHQRDGAIVLDSVTKILEIHGTTGGIPRGKCEQLDTWVSRKYREEPTGNFEGLFVVNSLRKQAPEERSGDLEPDTEAYMENRDHQIIRTVDVYRMLIGYKRDEITTEDVISQLQSDNTVLDFQSIDLS